MDKLFQMTLEAITTEILQISDDDFRLMYVNIDAINTEIDRQVVILKQQIADTVENKDSLKEELKEYL